MSLTLQELIVKKSEKKSYDALCNLLTATYNWPLTNADVEEMIYTIDQHLLHGTIGRSLQEQHVTMTVDQIDDDQDLCGETSWYKDLRLMTVVINHSLIAGVFDTNGAQYIAGGRVCRNPLQCFMYILMHELVHLIVYLYRNENGYYEWDQDHHGPLFRQISKNLFFQINYRHGIIAGFEAYADCDVIRNDVQDSKYVSMFTDNMEWKKARLIEMDEYDAIVKYKKDLYEIPIVLLRPLR